MILSITDTDNVDIGNHFCHNIWSWHDYYTNIENTKSVKSKFK